MKICVYSIAKDEQEHVNRFMDSCSGADLVVVGVDPGDTTGDILQSRGAMVHRVNLPKFRFDSYRNAVLEKIPDDVDVCVSLDLDEILPNGWRQIIENDWKPGTTKLHYHLKWDPNSSETFFYDRIHARHGYEWRHANHEGIFPIDESREKISQSSLVVEQKPDNTKDRSKNLGLLELAVEEEPDSARMRWYLGREYLMLERPKSAIGQLRRYMLLRSKWPAERSWACIFLSRAYNSLRLYAECEAWLHNSIRQAPDLRDGYVELAQHYIDREEFYLAVDELKLALQIRSNTHNFFHSNSSYTERVYLMKAYCHVMLDQRSQAGNCYKRALRINPDCIDVEEIDYLL